MDNVQPIDEIVGLGKIFGFYYQQINIEGNWVNQIFTMCQREVMRVSEGCKKKNINLTVDYKNINSTIDERWSIQLSNLHSN